MKKQLLALLLLSSSFLLHSSDSEGSSSEDSSDDSLCFSFLEKPEGPPSRYKSCPRINMENIQQLKRQHQKDLKVTQANKKRIDILERLLGLQTTQTSSGIPITISRKLQMIHTGLVGVLKTKTAVLQASNTVSQIVAHLAGNTPSTSQSHPLSRIGQLEAALGVRKQPGTLNFIYSAIEDRERKIEEQSQAISRLTGKLNQQSNRLDALERLLQNHQ